ncbi:hypothetical protein CJD36_007025 [Flavipsychrobacter stenotrophus]|uniref:Uncharacterized protein n=1 Tax=Flavipsychrobacter stenotrophus TaxID=2077091 RepID=A0A2S7SYE3_9BACT|nr:hypothetical protein [Flavipsychrobacter stenotrophus]PQJ11546.1 hypothetical protein CJD36_007025 [Flavipsychrobacter stenotrophus]
MKKPIITAAMAIFLITSAIAQDTKKVQQPKKNITGQDSTSPNRSPKMIPTDTAGKRWNNVAPTNKNGTIQPKGINPDSSRVNGMPPKM